MPTPTVPRFPSLADEFCARYGKATAAAYRSDLAIWSRWCEAKALDPSAASADDIDRYATAQMDERAANSARRRLSTLRSFHHFLRECGVRDDDPSQQARRPFIFRFDGHTRTLGRSSLDRCDALPSDDDPTGAAVVSLLAHHPVRLEDLLTGDVGHDPGQLTIRTGNSHYVVPLAPSVDARFARLDRSEVALLVGRTGRPLTRPGLQRRVRRVADDVTSTILQDSAVVRFAAAPVTVAERTAAARAAQVTGTVVR